MQKKSSYFDHMSSCSDLDFENNKSIFLHDTPTHNDASQHQVWKQMFGGLEDIIWTNINILNLRCDHESECSNPFIFSQDTLAYDNVSSDQVWLPRSQQFRKYSRKSDILDI